MSTSRNRRRDDRGMRAIWIVAVVLNLVVVIPFIVWDDLRRSNFTVEPKSAEELEAEKKKREELAKKPKPELDKEQVKQAKEHIERRKRKELKKKVDELKELKEEIEELKDEQLEALEQRDEDEFLDQLVDAVKEQAAELRHRAEDLERSDQNQEAKKLREQAQHIEREAGQLQKPQTTPEGVKQVADPQQAQKVAEVAKKMAEASKEYAEKQESAQATDVADRAERLADRAASLAGNDAQAALDGFSTDQQALTGDSEQMDSDALYDQARALEQQISEQFADSKAAELALTQDTSFQKGLEAVSTPRTQSADLGEALTGTPQTREELAAFSKALDDAIANAARAADRARDQLGQAQGRQQGREGGEGKEGQMAQAAMNAASLNNALGQASLQDGNARGMMVDLTGLMSQAYGGGSATESGIRAGSNQAEGGTGMLNSVKKSQLNLDANRIKAQALPGRKFSRSSARTGWLFIDSWYVLGPFENHGRIDYTQRHPPETQIDLDAHYVGKQGRDLTWKYLQSNVMRINPFDEQSNSSYYGFTEVWFEEETDMLLAVASDDAAKVWINDIVVWQDTGLSAWQLDEGFRKVRFKKGFNTVLVRIENGPVVCYYSLLLCPTDL